MRRHPEAPAAVLGSSCAVARVGLAAAWDGAKSPRLEKSRSQERAEGNWPWPQPSRGGRAGTGKGAAREQVSPAGGEYCWLEQAAAVARSKRGAVLSVRTVKRASDALDILSLAFRRIADDARNYRWSVWRRELEPEWRKPPTWLRSRSKNFEHGRQDGPGVAHGSRQANRSRGSRCQELRT
ncbi:hypothetical protein PVAP13_3KG228321 [Panicum virgatum]|uniref:Uncharacterized protein n=1 Tax=Panicum virgatum TaxID=38727 RepID=A0A8T0V3Z1_PANVG|nr:hypothetical protein PVAP13_3KG228321 [Panicum virgatum]